MWRVFAEVSVHVGSAQLSILAGIVEVRDLKVKQRNEAEVHSVNNEKSITNYQNQL